MTNQNVNRLFILFCSGALLLVGCHRDAPTPALPAPTVAQSTPTPEPTAKPGPTATPAPPVTAKALAGRWLRTDRRMITTFKPNGDYSLEVVGYGKVTQGKYRLLDGHHVEFSNRGKKGVNRVAIEYGQLILTNPDGSSVQWSRTR